MAAPALQQAVLSVLSRYPGLDPRAVLAVSSMEGLSGGIGDGGHAFGPFQENNAGGVLTGRFPGMNTQQLQAWAISPEGINDAISKINGVAKGLKGNAAINAIVSRFERPQNPGAEIAGAEARYGNYAGVRAQPGAPGQGASNPPLLPQQPQGPSQADLARNALMSMVQGSSQSIAQGQGVPQVNPIALLQTLSQAAQPDTQPSSGGGTAGLTGPPTPSTPGGTGGKSIVTAAKSFLGVPYQWGGNDPTKGLDCSSFVQQAMAKVGIHIPRTTYDQIKHGTPVTLSNLKPGDAVFTEPGANGPNHVGLYIGNGQVQESPHTGTVNSVIPLKAFLGGGFVGARRYSA